MKSRSKIALFSNERHFEIWFPEKKTITFFWSKLSQLHKKDPILHEATSFSLKQGETRTSHGPIPHPLIIRIRFDLSSLLFGWFLGQRLYSWNHVQHMFCHQRNTSSLWLEKSAIYEQNRISSSDSEIIYPQSGQASMFSNHYSYTARWIRLVQGVIDTNWLDLKALN